MNPHTHTCNAMEDGPCPEIATHTAAYQSNRMPAPSFLRFCARHAGTWLRAWGAGEIARMKLVSVTERSV